MKAKLSLTLDESLVAFVDAEPGESRSEKIESMLRRYREARQDLALRQELAAHDAASSDDAESAAWRQVMEGSQWNESAAATSGPSPSPRSRSRARR